MVQGGTMVKAFDGEKMQLTPDHGSGQQSRQSGERTSPRTTGEGTGLNRRQATSTLRRVSTAAVDKRQIFKQMVVAELEAGFLRYSRRQALMRYAKRIGIGEFDATLLMAEAQFYADQIEPGHVDVLLADEAGPFVVSEEARAWSAPARLMFAAGTALLVDLVLVYWLIL